MKVYRTGRRGSAWSKWFDDYKDARTIFRDRLKGKDPFRWKMKLAKDWSGECDLAKVMRNADREAPGMGDENAFWAKVSSGSIFVIDSGTEHISIPPAPDNVSPSIARAHNLTFTKTEQLDSGRSRLAARRHDGICGLQDHLGDRVPSQHCPGPPSPDGGTRWIGSSSGPTDRSTSPLRTRS